MPASKRNNTHIITMALLIAALGFSAVSITCGPGEPELNGISFSRYYARLFDSSETMRKRAYDAIKEMGADAVPWLAKEWDDATTEQKYVIAELIAAAGPGAVEAKPVLMDGLEALDERLIGYSAQALGAMGPEAADATPELARLLLSADFTTQIKILKALGNIGPQAAEAIPRMMEAAMRPRTRSVAIEALGKMGDKAVDGVMIWLQEGTAEQKLIACEILGGATGNVAKALPYLTEAFHAKDPKLRVAAVRAIGRAGPHATIVLNELIEALADRDKDMQRETIGTLVAIGSDSAGAKMIEAMQHPNGDIREGAIKVVTRWESVRNQARSILIRRLGDSHAGARYAAVLALTNMGETIVPDMIRLLNSSSVQQRGAACTVLGNIGRPARDALPELRKLTKDRDSYVAKEAQKAINRIQ